MFGFLASDVMLTLQFSWIMQVQLTPLLLGCGASWGRVTRSQRKSLSRYRPPAQPLEPGRVSGSVSSDDSWHSRNSAQVKCASVTGQHDGQNYFYIKTETNKVLCSWDWLHLQIWHLYLEINFSMFHALFIQHFASKPHSELLKFCR